MVTFLTLTEGSGHIDTFVKAFGRSYGREISESTYCDLLRRGPAPEVTYVFTDCCRMNDAQREVAINLWIRLADEGHRLYNNPKRQLDRFDLLRTLFEKGVNDFNVHHLSEIDRRVRYPVFLRIGRDHNGPRTGLLDTQAEVEVEASRLMLLGYRSEEIIAVEYVDVADDEGYYSKRGVLKSGDVYVANHIYRTPTWVTKSHDRLKTDEAVEASDEFFLTNPDLTLLQPCFQIAQIDYGRIDYSVTDGKLRVWEINDNPEFVVSVQWTAVPKQDAWLAAFRSLDTGNRSGEVQSSTVRA